MMSLQLDKTLSGFKIQRPVQWVLHIWVVTRHQYGILRSFLRRHFAGKPVVVSPNVGCFSRAT